MSPLRIDRTRCIKRGVLIVRENLVAASQKRSKCYRQFLHFIAMQGQTPLDPESRAIITQNLSFIARFGSFMRRLKSNLALLVLAPNVTKRTPSSLLFANLFSPRSIGCSLYFRPPDELQPLIIESNPTTTRGVPSLPLGLWGPFSSAQPSLVSSRTSSLQAPGDNKSGTPPITAQPALFSCDRRLKNPVTQTVF
jgi:hypothetical protein